MERVVEDLEQRVLDSQKLVHYVAKRYLKVLPSRKIEYDDITQIGMMGLMKAAERFDENYGVKFSTYAVPMIKGEILRFLRDYSEGVKFPRSARYISKKVAEFNWHKEKPEWIAEQLEVKVNAVKTAFEYMNNRQALNIEQTVFADDGQDITLGDTMGTFDDNTGVHVSEFIESLDERDQIIAKGILNERSQKEIGKEIGCSQVQVSRLQKQIGLKLKKYLGVNELMRKEAKGDLKRAKHLLQTTDTPAREIAELTGCSINSVRTYATKLRTKKSVDKAVVQISEKVAEQAKEEAPRDKAKDQAGEFVKELESELNKLKERNDSKNKEIGRLMKENGDLRKKCEAVSEMYDSTTEELRDTKQKLFETENQASLLEDELSAYKEKLEKSEQNYVELMNRNSEIVAASKRLEAKVEELTRESLFANEDETAELRHKIECLEKTLICYIGRG